MHWVLQAGHANELQRERLATAERHRMVRQAREVRREQRRHHPGEPARPRLVAV